MTFLMRALMATAGQREWDGTTPHFEALCRELSARGLCSAWPDCRATPEGMAAIARAREGIRLLNHPPPRLVSSQRE